MIPIFIDAASLSRDEAGFYLLIPFTTGQRASTVKTYLEDHVSLHYTVLLSRIAEVLKACFWKELRIVREVIALSEHDDASVDYQFPHSRRVIPVSFVASP